MRQLGCFGKWLKGEEINADNAETLLGVTEEYDIPMLVRDVKV
jgi:hypothetical protein